MLVSTAADRVCRTMHFIKLVPVCIKSHLGYTMQAQQCYLKRDPNRYAYNDLTNGG